MTCLSLQVKLFQMKSGNGLHQHLPNKKRYKYIHVGLNVAIKIPGGQEIRRMFNDLLTISLFYNVDSWNFDMFSFSRASKGSPLKFLGMYN